jgi:methionyl-tRNA formyltransferase
MKIGFFGTPEIAAYCLNDLKEHYEIAFVVTQDDKPCGRHLHITCCEAKSAAMECCVPVHHPENMREPGFLKTLAAYGAEIFVVVAYGRIIPAEVFTMPPLGTINLHPSLLPRYRGAAPIQWAIFHGETETGITVQMINERLDAGDIILQEKIPLGPDTTAGELYQAVLPAGAALLRRAINLLGEGKAEPMKQNEALSTYCGKIDRASSHIDWNAGAAAIHNMVRAFNPRPAAWTGFRGRHYKIWRTAPVTEKLPRDLLPGEVTGLHRKLYAGTGDGVIEITQIQPETKKIMDGLSFTNGHRLVEGERFD